MSDQKNYADLSLAGDFEKPTYEQWLKVVDKALGGAPFEKKMVTRTYEGFDLKPLYTREDWEAGGDPAGLPGADPFTRGAHASGAAAEGWDICQEHAHPDVKTTSEAILKDLERGVNSILLRIDDGHTGGVGIESLAELKAALEGVYLDVAPLALGAGANAVAAAALLAALLKEKNIKPGDARVHFGVDPLGTLAGTGGLSSSVADALAQAADLAQWTGKNLPKATALCVDTSAYHGAGASEAQDLAISMSTALAYLRALEAAGMDMDAACAQIAFTYSLSADQFLGVAKLRAARALWARVAGACGASENARAMAHLHATTGRRILTKNDPWVNMLRTTVVTFAGAVGGADAVTVAPFDAAIGLPNDLARRVARNTQLILGEESNLFRVVDPAGGSWYVERRTEQLAEAAWIFFQQIEEKGGMLEALGSGFIAEQINAVHESRAKNIARRKDPITGVSEFPNIHEELPAREVPAPRKRANDPALQGLPAAGGGALFEALVEAAGKGASLSAIATGIADGGARMQALPLRRLSEPFEAMRDASDAALAGKGSRPSVFLANLGRVAQHTARASYAKNFFEAGGILALGNDGFSDPAAMAAAFKESGAKIAVLCGSDDQYAELVASFAPALRDAGASRIYLAGNPGENEETYRKAGVEEFVFVGCNVLDSVGGALAHLGVQGGAA
ncbi:MAG: methylmalonyl-CoA mutase small subunit [Chrysiogenetes bacterium]|nr:methylmalonyl-CoA mutase small subunit [Chrysiogenetes bacterium]